MSWNSPKKQAVTQYNIMSLQRGVDFSPHEASASIFAGPTIIRSFSAYTNSMKFRIVLKFDPNTDSYSAICPELPGCASAGITEEEASSNIEEAIRLYLSPAEISLPETAKLVEVTIG